MKIFHLFFLLAICISCTNTAHRQAVELEKELKKVSIHSVQFDSIIRKVNELPNKERILCLLTITERDEVRIDGILKQEKLLNEVLPIASDELQKRILLSLIVIYNKEMKNGIPNAPQNTLNCIKDLEEHHELSTEESWQVRKHKALILNKLGKQEEYLPIWYELLKEHRDANKPIYIIEDLLTIATHFNKLGDSEQAISLHKEAYQLATNNSLWEERNKCLLTLFKLLIETENYVEALNYYHKLEASPTPPQNAMISNAATCYIHLNKPDSARYYLNHKLVPQEHEKMRYNCQMAETYTIEEKADSASYYLDLAVRHFYKESGGGTDLHLPVCFLTAYSSVAKLLQKQGKMYEAEYSFKFVEPLMKEETQAPIQLKEQITTLTNFSNFYRKTKQYEKALNLIAHRDSIQKIYYDIKEKSNKKNLVERFKIQELQHTINMQDSQSKFVHKQLIIVTTFSILLFATLATLFILIYKARKKNRTIDEQNKVIQHYETQSGEISSDKALYLLAEKAVTSQKLFLDKELSIVTLSEMVKTNRTYLSNCINKHAGANFTSWINNYRIEYAIQLMHSSAGNISLKELADQCGFKNDSTFTRNFKQQYIIPPSEYLKRIIVEQNNLLTDL